MKKISNRIQRLSQRAAQLREVVEAMPAKAAEIRDAVATTTGQVQQLRADLAAGVASFRPGNDADSPAALRAIDGAAGVLLEAGYALGGVDMDLAAGRRLRVRLERFEDVDAAKLRALLAAHAHEPVAKTLLSAIVHATEIAAKVELTQLDFTEVVVDMTTGQAIRIGWRAEQPQAAAPAFAAVGPPPLPVGAKAPTFSQSTFFERAAPAAAPSTTSASTAGAAAGSATPSAAANPAAGVSAPGKPAASAPLAPNWRASALDRFKKMPDLSKRTQG